MASGNAPKKAQPSRTKIAIFTGAGIVVLILGVGIFFTVTSTAVVARTPSPSEAAALLSSYDLVKRPVTVTLPTELTRTSQSATLNEDNLLQDYLDGQVLRQLGLITVDFTVVKADKPECYRYDYDYSRRTAYPGYGQEPYEIMRKPNGTLEKCNDVWNYATSIKVVDSTIADKASVSQRVQSLNDIVDTRPRNGRAVIMPAGSAGTTTVSLGSVEIVEVSDVVPGQQPGTATLGFKYRLNLTPVGEVFDVASPIHKAMPAGVRTLLEDPQLDERLTNAVKGIDTDGLRFGHAVLTIEGSLIRQWRISEVHFDSKDNTNYTFHHVE